MAACPYVNRPARISVPGGVGREREKHCLPDLHILFVVSFQWAIRSHSSKKIIQIDRERSPFVIIIVINL